MLLEEVGLGGEKMKMDESIESEGSTSDDISLMMNDPMASRLSSRIDLFTHPALKFVLLSYYYHHHNASTLSFPMISAPALLVKSWVSFLHSVFQIYVTVHLAPFILLITPRPSTTWYIPRHIIQCFPKYHIY